MNNNYRQYLPSFILKPDPSLYLSENYLVIDFETSNLDKGDPTNPNNFLVLTCWYDNKTKQYHTVRAGEFEQEELLSSIQAADFIVAHNAKFELGWLKRCGLPLQTAKVWCTQIAEYTLSGGRRRPIDLDSCLKRRRASLKHKLGKALVHGGVPPEEVPESVLDAYVKDDVKGTFILFQSQRRTIFQKGLEKVVYTRNMFTPCLADIEFNGMMLDKDLVLEMYNKDSEALKQVERELFEITGGINPNSNKQLAEFVYDTLGIAELKDRRGNPVRTDGGQRSVSEKTLGKLSPRNKRQRNFLRLKQSQAELHGRLSKYLEKLKDCCEQSDCILKFNFNQTITATGRLSSNGKRHKIQGQNINRDLKKLFKGKYGIIQERDHKGLEFRESGELTRDPQVIRDISEGFDVHSYTSKVLTESGQPTDRQGAKAHTFKPLYGGTSGTPAEQAYYEAFKKKYHVLTETQDGWVNDALRTGQYVSPTGNIFYFPDLHVTRSGYIHGNTAVRDYPIQYFATGELVPVGVFHFWHILKSLETKSYIVNTIHDSVVNELFPEEEELINEVAVQALTTYTKEYMFNLYGIELVVPLDVDLKSKSHWG